MHFLFSKIQKTNERKKIIFFVIVDICLYVRHALGRCTWKLQRRVFRYMYLFVFPFFGFAAFFFSSLLLLAFSLASLHFVVCKLELWIILSGFCCCCCVCLSGGSCDRLFGIYDFNMKTEKWLEHQIHDIHTSDSSNNQIHTFPVIYSVSGYFFFHSFLPRESGEYWTRLNAMRQEVAE